MVICTPNVDGLTGNFDHKRKAWLVIWEAGVIIEIPAGVFVAYPSSLFYHFNWDIGELDLFDLEIVILTVCVHRGGHHRGRFSPNPGK